MARTAKTLIKIQNAGVPLGTFFDTIDLNTGLSGTDLGGSIVEFDASGGGAGTNVATQKLIPTTSGSNITLDLTGLAHTFTSIQFISKNGQIMDSSDATYGWSQSTNTVTVLNAANTDIFLVNYNY